MSKHGDVKSARGGGGLLAGVLGSMEPFLVFDACLRHAAFKVPAGGTNTQESWSVSAKAMLVPACF